MPALEAPGGPEERPGSRQPGCVRTEMEVTEIILAKIYRFCQLSSHSRGFFAKVKIFNSKGPSLWVSLAHKIPTYDTNMLPKMVFDNTAFVKFLISMTFKFQQNIDETDSKQPKIHRKNHTSLSIRAYGF